jgi:hypothetical protein
MSNIRTNKTFSFFLNRTNSPRTDFTKTTERWRMSSLQKKTN